METWRLIKTIQDNGAMQMAIDEAILTARIRGLVPNTLRFFTWKPACVTIGFFQGLEQEVDTVKLREQGIDVVRRYTGGGAVFHDKELTYSLTVSEKIVPQDIIESYKIICSALIEGLNLLGICSEFRAINDVIIGDKKISGNAQTRKEGVLLQHGTILIETDVDKMFSLLKIPDEKIKDKLIKNAKERVTSLKQELKKEISLEEMEKYLIKGFEKIFNIEFKEEELTSEEIQIAKELYLKKYSNKEWNYQR